MDKIKCGLDLDGCVYKFWEPIKDFIELDGINVDDHSYDMGLSQEKVKDYLIGFGKTKPFLWIPMYPGVREQLGRLSKEMDFYIITHRDWYPEAKEQTLWRLRQDEIKYKEIKFSNEKALYAKHFGLNCFIEDNLNNARSIAANSRTKVILIDRPYNQGNFNINENIIRIKSLDELR